MNAFTVSYDRKLPSFRFAPLTACALALALSACAGADAAPNSGPRPETVAEAAAEAVPSRLASAPVASLEEQWRAPFAAHSFGEMVAREGRSAQQVRVRPADQRVREIAWGTLADRAQKGSMARAHVTVSVPTPTAVATAATLPAVAQGRTAADEIE
jgi:hypothetical protein